MPSVQVLGVVFTRRVVSTQIRRKANKSSLIKKHASHVGHLYTMIVDIYVRLTRWARTPHGRDGMPVGPTCGRVKRDLADIEAIRWIEGGLLHFQGEMMGGGGEC